MPPVVKPVARRPTTTTTTTKPRPPSPSPSLSPPPPPKQDESMDELTEDVDDSEEEEEDEDYKKSSPLKRRTTRRRTETSYDEKTTHYLKTMFFEVYGNGRKLSKPERRRIEKQTGLKSRKITYWFSNQKRRFRPELKAFQQLVAQGTVKSYDDFLRWCEVNDMNQVAKDNNITT
ncbi:hypothetical protein BJV82DRAFT_578353 [Fennellomyces sp. T-0311]|nr:hypothetical protein BJV82DRAFT_578353 [Fennellomyces sp. T-0311]